ncbi:Molybdopterin molybdenumtransferase, partial [Haemophilus influenzae]
SNPANHSLLVN